MSVNDRLNMPDVQFGQKGVRRDFLRVPRWLRSILGIPLEMKLFGANLMIVIVAVLLLGATSIQPARLGDAYVFVVALIVGAAVNLALVKLALAPIDALERVAQRVSKGHLGERVPASLVADRGLAHLSATINVMLDSLEVGRDRMRKLGAEVVYAGERERAHVARELHDSVAQTIAAANFQITAAAHELAGHEVSPLLASARELLRTAVEEVRDVSRSLHPRVAVDLGLPTALEALGDATQQRSHVDVRVDVDISGVVIPQALSTTLYRVAQEALRYIERHANAGHATLSLCARPGYVQLEVTDDGSGLEGAAEKERGETGLATMRERLSLAGGELHIDTVGDTGTRITAWVGMETEAA
jgi:signal transduction histidine kinase